MKFKHWGIIFALSALLAGCVSQSKYDSIEKENQAMSDKLAATTAELAESSNKLDEQAKQITELDQLRSENEQLKKKLDLYRNAANPAGEQENSYDSTEEEEYINHLLEIKDFKAAWMDSWLNGKVPGVLFKIKNNGTKTLSEIEVTVYFTDDKGNNIAEDTYYPVLDSISSDYQELKPNYTFQFDGDHFYSSDKVPKEWKSGNAIIKITSITFKDES